MQVNDLQEYWYLYYCILEQKPNNLATLITCLKTARCSGVMTFYKDSYGMVAPKATSYWCGVVPVELMRKALCHLDDQVSQPVVVKCIVSNHTR